MVPHLFTSRSATAGYALVIQSFLAEVRKRLGTMKSYVKLTEERVNPWVKREIMNKMRSI